MGTLKILPYKYQVLIRCGYVYRVRQKRTRYVLYDQYNDEYVMGTQSVCYGYIFGYFGVQNKIFYKLKCTGASFLVYLKKLYKFGILL